jgi:charged multivesicular body protein 2A
MLYPGLWQILRLVMGNLWAKKPLREVMRENKRMINRAIRELDRERATLEKNEKKLIVDIKKFAKEGQMVRPREFSP